jgi:WD40 repeat protein
VGRPLAHCPRDPRRHAGAIHSQSISADGSTLYTGSFDTKVLGWDLTGRLGLAPSFVAADTDPSFQFWSLAISPDGRTIAVGSTSGVVNLWNIATVRRIRQFRAVPEGGGIGALSFAPDGNSLLVAADTPEPRRAWLRIWKLGPRPRLLRSLSGVQRITWAAWSPDGKTIAATGRQLSQDPSRAGVVAEWNAATGRPLGPPRVVSAGEPVDLAFAPSGTTVAIGGVNGFVEVLDPAKGTVQSRFSPPGASWTLGVAFSPDGSKLATTDFNGSLDLWDPKTGKMLGAPIPDPGQSVTNSVAWSPDGRTIALTD